MKKYLIFMIFIFVININIVDAAIKVNAARPDSITLTSKGSDCTDKGCIKGTYVNDEKPIETYRKKGTVGSDEGVHLYCAQKGVSAPDKDAILSLPGELDDRISCFIFNTLDNSDVKKNYYAMNQGVLWSILGNLNIDTTEHFTKYGKAHMTKLIEKCPSSFVIQKPSITISRPSGDAGKKKSVDNYYNVKINLSHSNNDYSNMTGKLTVSLSGAPSGTIVTTSETGTTGVSQLNNGTTEFYIRIPSIEFVKLTSQLKITINVSSSSIKYKAFEYCETTTVDDVTSCVAGVQPLVPRRLFQVNGDTVTASKTITINPLSKCEYKVAAANSELIFITESEPANIEEETENDKIDWNASGTKNVNLNLNIIKECDPDDGSGSVTKNVTFSNIASVTEISSGYFDKLSDKDKIWAGGAVKILLKSNNTIDYKINEANIGDLASLQEKIKNNLSCDVNTESCTFDTSTVSVETVKSTIREKLKNHFTSLSILDKGITVSDDIGLIAKDGVQEGDLLITKAANPSFDWTSGEKYKLTIDSSIQISPKTSQLDLKTGNVCYGDDCASGEYYHEATDAYYISLKYHGDTYKFYINDVSGKSGNTGFKRWYYFDSLTKLSQSIKIKSKIYNCESSECKTPKFNLFYRQIDVNNPFPKGDYSITNWKNYYGDVEGNKTNREKIADIGDPEYIVPLGEVRASNDYSLSNIGANGESSLIEQYAGTVIGENIKTRKPQLFKLGEVVTVSGKVGDAR